MTVEKRGVPIANLKRVCKMDDDIVWSAWKHAAVCRKTVVVLRTTANITDEVTHLHLFVEMWHTLKNERPELFTDKLIQDVRAIVSNAVEHEIIWGKYIISEGVLGLTDDIIDGFVKSIADKRLKSMGLEPMYGVKSQVGWFDEASNINNTEENSFETKISAYQTGSLVW